MNKTHTSIIGVGTDIVNISRINEKISKKILTIDESKHYKSIENKIEYLAGRWAAKEAIIKAFPFELTMQEINITYKNNKPTWEKEGYKCNLSISHEKDYALAFCVIEKQGD